MKSRRSLIRARSDRTRSGNVMIEFALLAPVFFMLIMGLVEFVIFQYKTYALNHVVYEATRRRNDRLQHHLL
jgi:Flp pilus assembly protein TadG